MRAIPGGGTKVPVWILGSSPYGAQLAAFLGLPFAFASHFAPAMLEEALESYRAGFRPSAHLDQPHAMMTAGVCAAVTDEEATFLCSSQFLALPGWATYRLDEIIVTSMIQDQKARQRSSEITAKALGELCPELSSNG